MHSPPHTAVRDSQSSRSACTQNLKFMLLRGPPRPWRGGREGGEMGRWRPRGVRAGKARVGAEFAWFPGPPGSVCARAALQAAGRRSVPPPPLPGSLPGSPRGSATQLAGLLLSCSRLRSRPQVPVAQAANENAPRSLQGLHFVACGLAESPLGHVVIGGLEEGAGRERGSEPPAPPPSRHAFGSPGPAREGTSRWPHNKGCAAAPTSPQPLPGQCPPGPRPEGVWKPEGFQTQEAFGGGGGKALLTLS